VAIARITTPLHLMGETAVIRAATQVKEAGGSMTTTWTGDGSTVACSLQPGSSSEAVQQAMLLGSSTYDVYLATADTGGTALAFTQTQWKGATMTIGGLVYRVVGVPRDLINNGCVLHAVVERIDTGET